MDLSNFNPKFFPETNYKEQLKKNDLPAYLMMMLKTPEEFVGIHCHIPRELFNSSVSYARREKMASKFTETRFGTYMKKVFKDFYIHENKKNRYIFPSKKQILEKIDKYLDIVINEDSLNGEDTV